MSDSRKRSIEEGDRFELFGRLVTRQLRDLPRNVAIRLMAQINQLCADEEAKLHSTSPEKRPVTNHNVINTTPSAKLSKIPKIELVELDGSPKIIPVIKKETVDLNQHSTPFEIVEHTVSHDNLSDKKHAELSKSPVNCNLCEFTVMSSVEAQDRHIFDHLTKASNIHRYKCSICQFVSNCPKKAFAHSLTEIHRVDDLMGKFAGKIADLKTKYFGQQKISQKDARRSFMTKTVAKPLQKIKRKVLSDLTNDSTYTSLTLPSVATKAQQKFPNETITPRVMQSVESSAPSSTIADRETIDIEDIETLQAQNSSATIETTVMHENEVTSVKQSRSKAKDKIPLRKRELVRGVLGLAVGVLELSKPVKQVKRLRRFSVDPQRIMNQGPSEMELFNSYRQDDDEMRKFIGMNTRQFDWLFDRLKARLKHSPTHRNPITAEQRLVITLRYLVHGLSHKTLSEKFLIGAATVKFVVDEVLSVIINELHHEMIPFPTEDKWQEIAENFANICKFPHCIGVVDRAVMQCETVRMQGQCKLSVSLLAIIDANCRFVYVDLDDRQRMPTDLCHSISSSGFNDRIITDGTAILQPTSLPGSQVQMPFCFVAGEGYEGAEENVLRPFPEVNNPSLEQIGFNQRLKRVQCVSSATFGILAQKWQLFGQTIRGDVKGCKAKLHATIILHNFLQNDDKHVMPEDRRYISSGLFDQNDKDDRKVVESEGKNEEMSTSLAKTATKIHQDDSEKSLMACIVRNNLTQYFSLIKS